MFFFTLIQLDNLEMSNLSDCKGSVGGSKSTLKDESLKRNGKRGSHHAILMKWDNSPERSKMHLVWEKHGTTIALVLVTVVMLIYSIVAIGVSGFEKAKWFFYLTMFLWFCLTYMFVRNNCGGDIYHSVGKPCIDGIKTQWFWLKWLVFDMWYL